MLTPLMNNPFETKSRLFSHWHMNRTSGSVNGAGQPKEGEMNALTLLQQDAHSSATPQAAGEHRREEVQMLGAFIGLCGGVMVAVLGSLLTVAGWLTADTGAKHRLSTAGTVLLCLTIPLIVLGACCLDWLEKDKTQDLSQSVRGEADDDEL